MTAIHQFVATFEPGAIGNELVEAQKVLREAGYESEIFTEFGHESYTGNWRHYTEYAKNASDDDVLVYHMAIGSNVADWLLDRPERIVLRHHNITPVDFYSPWPDANTYGMAWGREQLRRFAPRAALGLAASEFNRQELEALRYRKTAVAPVFFDFAQFDRTPVIPANAGTHVESRGTSWLFVGWLAPHKCQHDLITAFSVYKKLYDPNAQLHIVGRTALESYEKACRALAEELCHSGEGQNLVNDETLASGALLDSGVRQNDSEVTESIHFHGRVTDAELGDFYRNSDVFVCMSEHEGVGLPLLESMHTGLPIVAFGAAAVPETVGDGGIVLPMKKPATVAAAAHRIITDRALREALVSNAKTQVLRFNFDSAKKAWLYEIAAVVGS